MTRKSSKRINGTRIRRKRNKRLRYRIQKVLILAIIFQRNITSLMRKEEKILNSKNKNTIKYRKSNNNIHNNHITNSNTNINKRTNKLDHKMIIKNKFKNKKSISMSSN